MAASAALIFALGIGAGTAVFALFDRLLLRELPYSNPSSLVHLYSSVSRAPSAAVLPFEVTRVLAREASVFHAIAWADGSIRPLSRSTERPLLVTQVTSNTLEVLGVRPQLGRAFNKEDDVAASAASAETPLLLTWEAWQSRFAKSDSVIGQAWSDDSGTFRVVGVLPSGFLLPTSRLMPEPYEAIYPIALGLEGQSGLGDLRIAPFARLGDGVSLEAAQARVNAIVSSQFPKRPWFQGVTVSPLQSALSLVVAPYLWAIVLAVATLLLVTCLSVSILLLMWARSRRLASGVQIALGASPLRLATSALMESLLICAAGGALGWLGYWCSHALLLGAIPSTLSGFATDPVALRVVGVTFGAACISALVAGVVPALVSARAHAMTVIRPERAVRSAAGRRAGALMLSVQAALGTILLIGAASTVPNFAALVIRAPGIAVRELRVLEVESQVLADIDRTRRSAALEAIVAAIRATPGVQSASATFYEPFTRGAIRQSPFWRSHGVEGHEWPVGAHFFETLGTRVLAGRDLSEDELTTDAPVVVINQAGMRVLWPGATAAEALGRIIDTPHGRLQVRGVVEDFRSHPEVPVAPGLFFPVGLSPLAAAQSSWPILLRAPEGVTVDTGLLAARLKQQASAELVTSYSVHDSLQPLLEQPRLLAILFGTLSAISLVVVVAGIYGLARSEIDRRYREIGIKLAIGMPARLLRYRLTQSIALPILIGVGCGVLLSWRADALLAGSLTEVTPGGWHVHVAGVVVMVVTVWLAAWLPSTSVSVCEPAEVMRRA